MSGRRRRALALAFRKEHGRAPYKARHVGWNQDRESVFDPQNELRPLKKAYVRGAR